MPIYEYKCTNPKCKHINEVIFFDINNATDKVICSKCYRRANRIISLSNFILKGDGWYDKPKKEKKDGN